MVESALTYVKNNFKVFPLNVNSKSEQILKSWKKEAFSDKKTVQYYWKLNPNYNIGIKTGDGLLVIDVDNKNGKKGSESIKEYIHQFPKTFLVKTPNGFHLYYKVKESYPNKVNLYEGIDIRCEGGYVVAPPSIVDGKNYKVVHDVDIAEANEAVYAFLEGNKKPSVESIKEESIPTGSRNDTLFRLACYMHSKGFSDKAIELSIHYENKERCVPPLPKHEIDIIVDSVIHRYDKGKIETDNEVNIVGESLLVDDFNEVDDHSDIIEGLLSVGVNIVGGPQKEGKTFLCMQMANAISTGKDFLGRKAQQGSVCYFAFEDLKHKINKRIQTMNLDRNDDFDIRKIVAYDEKFDMEKLVEKLKQMHPNLKLVVIDTYAKIKKRPASSVKNIYDFEYKEVAEFHDIAVKYDIAILLVTHITKYINRERPFDCIYGSRGITAAVDGMMVLLKPSIDSDIKELFVTGKDIPEDHLVVKQNENLVYEIVDEDVEADAVDEAIIRVMNFLYLNKQYEGTCEMLCAKLTLGITARKLSSLLTQYTRLLKEHYISYQKLERTSQARKIKLVYTGEEE